MPPVDSFESALEKALRIFADLYPDIDSSRLLVQLAGLRTGWIGFSPVPFQNWYRIWRAAIDQQKEMELVQAALRGMPDNNDLQKLKKQLVDYPEALHGEILLEDRKTWSGWLVGLMAVAVALAMVALIFALFRLQVVAITLAVASLVISVILFWLFRRKLRAKRDLDQRAAESFEHRAKRKAFRGLSPYDEKDKLPGATRRAFAELIATQVLDSEFSLGVVSGDVGCGKTSLLRAALYNFLQAKGHPVCVVSRPRDLGSLIALNSDLLETRLQRLTELALAKQFSGERLVLIIDQFEEFLIDHPAPDSINRIRDCLQGLLRTDNPVRILCGIRRDFILSMHAVTLGQPSLIYERNLFELKNFSVEEAEEVLRDCASIDGLVYDSTLPLTIAGDLATGGIVRPPELQIVCTALRDQLSETRYRQLGGTPGLLSQNIQGTLDWCSDPALGRRVLRALCDFSPRARGARRPQLIGEIAHRVDVDPSAQEAVRHMYNILGQLKLARLIVQYGPTEANDGETRFALFHDYLVEAVDNATRNERTRSEKADQQLDYFLDRSATQAHRESIPFGKLIFILRYAGTAKRSESNARRLLRYNVLQYFAWSVVGTGTVLLVAAGGFAYTKVEWNAFHSEVIDFHGEECVPTPVIVLSQGPDSVLTIEAEAGKAKLWSTKDAQLLQSVKTETVLANEDYMVVGTKNSPWVAIHVPSWKRIEIPGPAWSPMMPPPRLVQEEVFLWHEIVLGNEPGCLSKAEPPIHHIVSLSDGQELMKLKDPSLIFNAQYHFSRPRDLFVTTRLSGDRVVASAGKISTAKWQKDLVSGANARVIVVAFDDKAGRILTMEGDRSVHLWSADSLEHITATGPLWQVGSPAYVRSIAPPPDYVSADGLLEFLDGGEYLLVGSGMPVGEAVIFRASDLARKMPDGARGARWVRVSTEKRHVGYFYWSLDGRDSMFWKPGPERPRLLRDLSLTDQDHVEIDRSEARMIVQRKGRRIELWDLVAARPLKILEGDGDASQALPVFFSMDGKLVGIPHAGDKDAILYRLSDGSLFGQLKNTADETAALYFDEVHQRIHSWTNRGSVIRTTRGTWLPGFHFFPAARQFPELPRRCKSRLVK